MMTEQLSMIEEKGPDGFKYFPDFISINEEQKLLAFLRTLDWQNIHMHGVIAKRKVVHFGLDYAYDSRSLSPTTPPPDELQFLLKRAAKLLKVKPNDFKEILITYYPVGSQIGWHRDAPMFESLFGISLSGMCKFKLRKEKQLYVTELKSRSGYIIQGEARWKWQHHIPAVKEERYSITLRTLKN